MAANNQIVKKSIQIDAGDTLRTVKSLKQEISDLRDELLNLEKGTEEYDQVQKQLTDDVNDLNEVMGAHKEKAQALEGSYNDLQNQLKELKTAWKETNDEAERDVLGQKINELNTQLKEMDASIGDFHRNVGNYESAWNGLTGVMENGDKITDDLEKGIKAFGTALGMSDKQVNALSKSLKSLKDGFKIAKDIAKAKEESTKLAAAEQQAAAGGTALATSQKAAGTAAKTMAVSEGTATVATKGLSVAMRGLKAALISTGIGALIVALGSLIGLMDKAIQKLNKANFEKKYGDLAAVTENIADLNDKRYKRMEDEQHQIELNTRLAKARGETEGQILNTQKEELETQLWMAKNQQSAAKTNLETYKAVMETMKKREKESEEIQKQLATYERLAEMWTGKVSEIESELQDINDDILVYNEEQKYAVNNAAKTTDEIKKWADLIKDPKFQADWKALFSTEFEGNSPIEVLKAQKEAATALVNEYKGDASEVERYFEQLISEAEAEWQSLVDKEQQIFDERLTPAQRLENEKAEWIDKANKWGMETVNIVKYYDDKIQDELDKAEKERQAKLDAEIKESEDKLNEFLSQVDATLDTQEKLDELFNTRGMAITSFWSKNGTVQGEIEQDMEDIQRLYDTQMEYLNGLLESADLTEEAYAGVEDRIRSLTVTFNNQMNKLKEEQEYQGKNFRLISKKWEANFANMEQAAGDFADAFAAGGEKTVGLYKGFATAQSLIAAFLAMNEVLAAEPGEMLTKIAAATATFSVAIANVMSIIGTNTDGSNANSMMTNNAQSAVPVIGNSQPISYSRNLTTAEEEDRLNQPIWVSVVDIDEGLEGQRVRVENSSF